MERARQMVVSSWWLQIAVVTFLLGFGVLAYLAYSLYDERPPVPAAVESEGKLLFAGDEILAGQHVFQKYGLMQHGTLFGHGAYLGPDFTAQYLHEAGRVMTDHYGAAGASEEQARAAVQRDFKQNLYDRASGRLSLSPAQTRAYGHMLRFYGAYFGPATAQGTLQRPSISDPQELRSLTAYFAWAAWVATSVRPGADYSYTNNWPPDALAGNEPTSEAFLWSVLSLIALLGGVGIILFAFGRWHLLGWHAAGEGLPPETRFRVPGEVRLTASQRASAWCFLVVAGLFLMQGLLGGVNAHYHVEPGSFYGFDIAALLPYNLSRMWHVQLALFFVAASFLAMGVFITPMIALYEPKHQGTLAAVLFGALVLVVVGSLAGEALSLRNTISLDGPWFWLGSQGWEYLDLGRLWQMLLVAGMLLWVIILVRGLRRRLQGEHPGNLPYLFLYSALSIPLFYAVGMLFGRQSSFAIVDFWRFWVVHLWVEDFLELFTTIMVAILFVLLGVVRPVTATRLVYLDIILYSVGGVIGTMHHLYFSGAPAQHMALGAFFSAMEVIPLVLLTFEAWRFMQLGGRGGASTMQTNSAEFPHKWAVMFLIAVGFWNFLGAGVFGFLINLPIVSYYEIGTTLTANHGHGALMGVYGMLAIGFFMFVARYFVPADRQADRAMRLSFWSLNLGLFLMLFANLVPIGILQLNDSFANGYWHAREPAFYAQPLVRAFEWLRLPGDLLFIVGGILPVVYLAVRMFVGSLRDGRRPRGLEAERLTEAVPPRGDPPQRVAS